MTDCAVDDTGITEGRLAVLVVEDFFRDELLEFKPGAGGISGVVGFPVITCFVHVGELEEMTKRGTNYGCIRDGLW